MAWDTSSAPAKTEGGARPARRHPRLRTVLLTVNLLILLLPVGGIAILRLYENELIRRTEAELIVQGALVREAFRRDYLELAEARGETAPGRLLPGDYEPPIADADSDLTPIPARLDISTARVLPRASEAVAVDLAADPLAEQAAQALAPVLDESCKVTLAGIRIVDRNGIVVASSGTELSLSLAHREEVAAALDGRVISLLRTRVSDEPRPPLQSISRGLRYRVFVALPVIEGDRLLGAVVLSRTPLDISKALYLNRRPLLIGAAALLVVVVLVSVLTSLTISRPLRALNRQADQATGGERGAMVPLASPGTHEIARLSEALAAMARALERRADYIRTFASHVSHEFKTPLTTLRGSVELLRDHADEMSEQERERFLHNLARASERLERLVGRLLEQARADVLRPGGERCDLAAAVDDAAGRDGGPEIEVDHAGGVPPVRMAREMLVGILTSLIDNARQHGGEAVRVRISSRLDAAARPPRVELRVADDGPGISEANAARVFKPFFTTAREAGGSGLGLSIARALVEAHGGTIDLEPAERGATFVIRLPI